MNYEHAFQLVDLEVIRIDATQSGTTDEHAHWSVGYAPERVESMDRLARVVLGTLHAGGDNGWADITVGALYIHQNEDVTDDLLADAIGEADATESLYDYARSHLAGILATVGAHVQLPRKSPDPDVTKLIRSDSSDAQDTDNEESES
ncbi:hypothetical protein SOM11_00810 [Frigoribacterium sp. CFBP9039]|uniref:hypothetical protein n=1 Tax=Frigoribacterium sp. CFBP9029 TaxID=3096541 RepID=UPI002A6AF1E7|nr:hypothetical protein [Frigoribacterium sp. CFBP9039]MDY0944526.1 hypothetical protein [Frigoribacterium sp. CFBP9039]